jgi:hypothetical protein
MKNETREALQRELDDLEEKRQRAFGRGMMLGAALAVLGFFVGYLIGA